MADDTVIRTVHDLTQAAWFGGALMGAVGVEAASRAVPDRRWRVGIADAAWSAWQPVSTTAIAAHLLAGMAMTYENKARLSSESGALKVTVAKTAVTIGAVAADAYARRLGAEVSRHADAAVSATEATASADEATETAQRRLRWAQWAVVGLTGAMIAIGARMGEQQRPTQLARGIAERFGLAS